MNRLAHLILGAMVLAAAPTLRAQQINPRQPPPPPPAAAADSSSAGHPDSSAPAAGSSSSPHADEKPQPIDPTVPPPPPREEDAAPETPPASATPAFDPLHAQRSLDVGRFYLNKGSYDAAIDRFIEAANYQPSLAAPWKMLGEAYEKKHEYAKAAEAYNKYLDVVPHASDAAKIKKAIADLQEKSAQETPKKDQ